MNNILKKIRKFILDAAGGLILYPMLYFFTGTLLWLGIKLIDIYPVAYWQCVGICIVFRVLVNFFRVKPDIHLIGKDQVEYLNWYVNGGFEYAVDGATKKFRRKNDIQKVYSEHQLHTLFMEEQKWKISKNPGGVL